MEFNPGCKYSKEDPSPENCEIRTLVSRLGQVLSGSGSIDWEGSRQWCAGILNDWREGCGRSKEITRRLANAQRRRGGDEHILLKADDDPGRIYKSTFGDNFGCRIDFYPNDIELTGKHFFASVTGSIIFYLTRWYLLNNISGYQTRFEGFLPPDFPSILPRVCVSQLRMPVANPERKAIANAFRTYGFQAISEDAFLDFSSGVLLTDAAPRNVRVIDEIPVPFDAIAEIASTKVMAWAKGREVL